MRRAHAANAPVLDILSRDPVWAAYAIADLRLDLARHCRWHVAPDASGLALLYFGLAPPILLTAGTLEGVAASLAGADLPGELSLGVLPSHLPAVEEHYQQIRPRKMVRMVIPPGRPVPAPDQPVRCLARADASRLKTLYSHGGDYAPDAFDPCQLEDGFFLGIENEDGTLVAAGGTHVAFRTESPPPTNVNSNSPRCSSPVDATASQGVAAIGNIYTRPDCRGMGYGSAVTSSISRALQEDGFRVIVLNVDEQNLVARSIYEKLGFDVHCQFIEGFAARAME